MVKKDLSFKLLCEEFHEMNIERKANTGKQEVRELKNFRGEASDDDDDDLHRLRSGSTHLEFLLL